MTEFLFKSAISMAVLLAVYHLFLEREKIHKFNRFYLISALIFSIMLPFISITIPKYVTVSEPKAITLGHVTTIHQAEVKGQVQTDIIPEVVAKTEVSQSTVLQYLSIGIYAVVTLILSIRFGRNIFRFHKLKATNPNVPFKNATLVLLEEKVLPYTFMSTIYLNGEEYEQRKIEPELFTHELTHVRERHTIDILFIELLRTIMWFNPLLYFYKRAIRLNHEFLADDSTIDHHLDITSYQSLLLAKLTPVSVSSLASSINFGTTKKRFIMMTKTTNKVKGLLLRASVVPVVAGLTFLLATQTVTYAKSAGRAATAVILEQPVNTIPTINPDAVADVVLEQAPVLTDSATARRDEYYKNVRIKIEDKSRNLSIDTKYEQLTEAQKDLYLTEVPEKKKRMALTKEDYDYYIAQPDAQYYIDDKKVDASKIKGANLNDFASYRSKMSFADGVKLLQVFLYSQSYFDNHIKHATDRFPGTLYTITVLDKALDYNASAKQIKNVPADGKSGLEHAKDEIAREREKLSYSYPDLIKEIANKSAPRFPGGNGKFYSFFDDNFKMKDKIGDKPLFIMLSINTDGSVSEVKVNGASSEVESEIARVLEKSPKWIPAQEQGHAVKMGYTLNYPSKVK